MPERRAAVLGRPIAHSLSPALHRAAYAALGLDWSYDAIDCGAEDLREVLADRPDWAGFSCTMPLKREAVRIADEVRPVAAAIGAANTLLPREGGGWIADDTDVAGIVGALREHDVSPSSVTVLGAGGTAQAVIAALARLRIPACVALVRDVGRTGEVRAAGAALGVEVRVGNLVPAAVELGADLVVSTLPAGVADAFASFGWHAAQAVLDVVYDPWPTRLASAAADAGATVLSGALMLLHQAAAQVELMTGSPAPLDAMRAALPASSA